MSRRSLEASRTSVSSDGVDAEAATRSRTNPSFRPREEVMQALEGAKFTPIEEPFCPSDKLMVDGGEYSFALPESVYSAVIVGWLNQDDEFMPGVEVETCTCKFVKYMFPQVVNLFVCLVVQISLAYYLHQAASHDLADSCADTSSYLQWICLASFVTYWLQDVQESWAMHKWAQMLPSTPASSPESLRLQKFQDNDPDALEYLHEPPMLIRPVTGMTSRQRFTFYLLALAKASVSVMVLFAGSGTLLRSETNNDVILNSLAALFVLELDDVAFKVFTSSSAQKDLGGIPALGKAWAETSDFDVAMSYTYGYFMLATVAVISGGLNFGVWCVSEA